MTESPGFHDEAGNLGNKILRQSLAHSGPAAQREAVAFEELLHPPSIRRLKDQYSYTCTVLCLHSRCRQAVGLASCLWLVRTVSYFVMASGHEPPSYTQVMNKVYRSVDDNGDRPGYMNDSFSTTRLEVEAYNSLQS